MRQGADKRLGGLTAEEGYTLTEILVVMAIIGLLAAVLTPGLVGQLGRARAKTAKLQLDSVAAGVELFHSDLNRYPTTGEGLNALLSEPGATDGWTGPYLKDAKLLQDPWGNPIQYQLSTDGASFTVTSLGRDGKVGGSGLDRDIQSPG